MTRRMLDSSIWTNEHFGEMPMMARLLLLGIINHADDQGRIKAHLVFLRSQIFPYDDVTTEQIGESLQLIEANGTIATYEADGKRYIQLLNWWEYQSLQFAQPSDYPRHNGWHDRIRYNAKGHHILTFNWTTFNGETVEDSCEQDGTPLPIVATFTPGNPGGRPRKKTPENPGGNPPENPGGNINKIEIEEEIEIEEQEREGERAPARDAPVELPSRKAAAGKLKYKSPHVDKSHFDPSTGYIRPGIGTTAVEVYYERFDIQGNDARLTDPQEDDLVRLCPDLDKLREVVTAYSRTSFRLGNVQLILDWYRDGIPDKQISKSPSVNGRMSPVDKSMANASELRTLLAAQGKEGLLHG